MGGPYGAGAEKGGGGPQGRGVGAGGAHKTRVREGSGLYERGVGGVGVQRW